MVARPVKALRGFKVANDVGSAQKGFQMTFYRSDMTQELGGLGVPMSGKEYFRVHGISGIAPEEVNID